MTGQDAIFMLSIDDKSVTTDLDRAGYRQMGVFVKPANSFDEAKKILNARQIHIIVINMDHEPIDAIQITKHLKAQDKWNELPIVLTSVQSAAKVRKQALEAGADLFIEQPLPRQYFIEKLKQLLEQRVRDNARVDFEGEVNFVLNGESETLPIADLSASGMLVSTQRSLESGTNVVLEFVIPGYRKPIRCDGEVVRTIKIGGNDSQLGVGIRFVKFDGDGGKRLERYITKTQRDDSHMQYYL